MLVFLYFFAVDKFSVFILIFFFFFFCVNHATAFSFIAKGLSVLNFQHKFYDFFFSFYFAGNGAEECGFKGK